MVSLVGAMVVYWVLMSNFLFNTGKFIYSKCTVLVKLQLSCREIMTLLYTEKGLSILLNFDFSVILYDKLSEN